MTDQHQPPDLTEQLEEQRARAMEEYTRGPSRRGEPMYEPPPQPVRPARAMPGVGIPSSQWERQRMRQEAPPPLAGPTLQPMARPAPQAMARPLPTQPPMAQPAPTQQPMARPAANEPLRRPSAAIPPQPESPYAPPASEPQAQPRQRQRRAARTPQMAPPANRPSAPADEGGASRRAPRAQAARENPDAYADSFAQASPYRVYGDDERPTIDPARPAAEPIGLRDRARALPRWAWIALIVGAAAVVTLVILLASGALTSAAPSAHSGTPVDAPAGQSSAPAPARQTGDSPFLTAPEGLEAASPGEGPLAPSASTSTGGPTAQSLTASPAEGSAPLTVTFAIAGDAGIDSVRLLTREGAPMSGTLARTATDTGAAFTYTVRFDTPYAGSARLYLRDAAGAWRDSGLSCEITIR